jgi:enoyl-CoA hydratase
MEVYQVRTEVVLMDVVDRVATVTLNRPEARNALSPELLRVLPAVFDECDDRDDIDVVVLTGSDPAFCAGLDLKRLTKLSGGTRANSGDADSVREPVPVISKPVIGAINGPAVTGGLELALVCDFLVASERARFADTHARVGVMPGWGLTVRLAEAIGQRRARVMSTTGNFVDAETALLWGLVNHVVPHDELLGFCTGLALDIVSNDREGVRTLLGTYREQFDLVSGDGRRLELERSRAWSAREEFSSEVDRARRAAVVDRGRSQMG